MDFVRVQAAARKSLAANQQAVWKRSDVGIYIYVYNIIYIYTYII